MRKNAYGTDTCPECGGPLVRLSSQNIKLCFDCRTEHPWNLDPGQKSLIGSNRADRTKPNQENHS